MGRFVLELMVKQYYDNPIYLSSAKTMIDLNRSILLAGESLHGFGDTAREFQRITSAYAQIEFDSLSYDDDRQVFTVQYVVWDESFGDLTFYSMDISLLGECFLKQNRLLDTNIGYWLYRK